MATRSRDTALAGKEKRGTSPIQHQKSTTTTSKTTSPGRKQADPTLTTSSTLNKNVPSYLKPTIAQKKSASSSDLHNTNSTKISNLARRRSFDNKPPLPSSSPKTRISPSPRERIPRSSASLSTKTSTSQKPLLDNRLSKTTTSKDAIGKQRGAGLNSRPVTKRKTTTTTTRKHDSASGSTTKASETTNSTDIAQDVISQGEQSEPEDHQEPTIHETENETIVSDNEMIVDSDAGENENDSATEDHIEELINENVAELEDIKDAAESSTLVENPEIKIEEPEEINNEPDEHDSSEKETEETIINASEENQESKEEDEGTNQEKETPMVEETESLSPKQVGVGVEESTEAEPAKITNVVASSKSQHQVVQGKNNESVISNNVIEETASKLREQRKNKVKALAGAFETVISLQEHK